DDVPRQQRVKDLVGRRLELVQRQQLVGGRWLLALDHLQRQQANDLRPLGQHADELRVDDVNLIDTAVFATAFEVGEQDVGHLAGVGICRRVGEAAPVVGNRALTEPVV